MDTKTKNYQYLTEVWQQENMRSFKDFLRWNNSKKVVSTLEAMQKLVHFYHNKGIDMLKLRCTLRRVANICLHKTSTAKFYPITQNDNNTSEKICEDTVGGLSIVFTRKTIVDQHFIRDSTNWCKSVVGVDASQLYLLSVCQAMPTGL